MPTKGNTGQSSDSLGPLGKKQEWFETDYSTPNSGFKKVSNRGNMGFGSDNDVGLGAASKKSSPYASPTTAGPSVPQMGDSFKSISSRGNVNGYNEVGLGKSQKPGKP